MILVPFAPRGTKKTKVPFCSLFSKKGMPPPSPAASRTTLIFLSFAFGLIVIMGAIAPSIGATCGPLSSCTEAIILGVIGEVVVCIILLACALFEPVGTRASSLRPYPHPSSLSLEREAVLPSPSPFPCKRRDGYIEARSSAYIALKDVPAEQTVMQNQPKYPPSLMV